MSLIVFVGLAIAYSASQSARYQASSTVSLSRQNFASVILNTPGDQTAAVDPERIIATQASIAGSPTLSRYVIDGNKTLRIPPAQDSPLSRHQFEKNSWVVGNPNADLLTFYVVAPTPEAAKGLANAYASAYVLWRKSLDSRPYNAAQVALEKRAATLKCGAANPPANCADIQKALTQLSTASAVQAGNANLTTPADSTTKVQPKTVRNVLIGVLAAVIIGTLLAFGREAIDTRVRSEDDLNQTLGLAVLGRIRSPERGLRRSASLVMLRRPDSPDAEEFRSLRTNIDFANLPVGAKSVILVSAGEAEGKSTTAANLGVAFAEVGRSVLLLDLDLRRPTLHKFFDLESRPGFTNVLLGETSLADVVRNVPFAASGDGDRLASGNLDVITAGTHIADPARVLSLPIAGELIQKLRDEYDLVLIDSPPVLAVSDAMVVSANADAVLVIAHAQRLRKGALEELGRLLGLGTASGLGVVRTAAEAGSVGAYSYRYAGNYMPNGRVSSEQRELTRES